MAQLHVIRVLSIVLHLLLADAQQATLEESCPTATRPHMTRCDQYYRCTVLSKEAHVWVATQCQKGLVYLHNLGTCVVPDDDWECNVSAENEKNHSEENVYGIDNLNVPSLSPSSNSASEEELEEVPAILTSTDERTKSFSSSQIDQNDIESSGDGSSDEPHTSTVRTTNNVSTKAPVPVVTPTTIPGSLNASQLDSFLAYYDTQNVLKLKTKQATSKMDEKNYLEHLKQIVNQQKELNEMARIPSHSNPISYETVPVQQLIKKKDIPVEEPLSKLNLSPGMQDIIRSILDISQKAIANQKSAAPSSAAPAPEVKDPVVKPIFIPISVNPVPAPSVQQPTTTERPFNVPYGGGSSSFSSNSFRIPDMNDTTFNDFPQQVLYDAYGNRYVPKDASYQPMPPSYPNSVYNSYLNRSPQSSQLMINSPTGPYFASSSLTSPLQGGPSRLSEPFSYFPNSKPSSQQLNPLLRDYETLGDFNDRVKLPESIESIENDSGQDGSLEKDLPLPVNRHSVDVDEENSNENADSAESKYKRKLFTVGEVTFDYEQYKDSMLPLVDANPEDDRISVVMCMIGSRQPNNTDCFRYYICNPHNGMFQSYTCPPFTSFNKNSRMCDLTTYKQCKDKMTPPAPPRPKLRTRKEPPATQSVSQINQIKQELRKAQKYVELIRLEANKLRRHNSIPSSESQQVVFLPYLGGHTKEHSTVKPKKVPAKKRRVTAKPAVKVPRCRLEGRMADPMDKSNYYVCHRKSPNKFIKLKMACPLDLLYCADTQYCTLSSKC
uniref:Chitin-binding type-2 domain-containing protein n=1 Tax=Anopheles culicifacies TaxID=139723 RepID=A0A182MAS5_9DIPT